MTTALLVLLASYLIGAIPFGLVMARVIKGVDLRTVGSGNIGATNAMRVLGKPLGLAAFLLDFAKGLPDGDPRKTLPLAAETPFLAEALAGTAAVRTARLPRLQGGGSGDRLRRDRGRRADGLRGVGVAWL